MATEGSSAVILNDKHKILLVLRRDARIWSLPGGGREAGETFEQLVGEYWRPQYPNGGDRMRVFKARILGGDPSKRDQESLDVRWFPLDKLPKTLWPFAREHVQDALANSKESVSKEQKLSGIWAVFKTCFFAFRKVRNRIRHHR
jgi:8-oxo-dGTP pyrophosphatase MutT (NUDIX family)